MQMAARRAVGGRDEVVEGRVVNSNSRWSFLLCLTSIHFLVQEKSSVMQLNICVVSCGCAREASTRSWRAGGAVMTVDKGVGT